MSDASLSQGPGLVFSAGADLDEVRVTLRTRPAMETLLDAWRSTFEQIERLRKPVIAGLNGITLAGGLELALSCDAIIATESARVGDAHIAYGLVPGGGGSQRLPRAIGVRAARWLMYTGGVVSAAQAESLGLVQQVIADDDWPVKSLELCQSIATRSAPALAFMKAHTMDQRVTSDGLTLEFLAAISVLQAEDAQEGLDAFVSKRPPLFPSVVGQKS